MKLKLYYITDDYIDYLRQYDKKVFYNKNNKRPYIGVVLKYNNYNYFAPLASPKTKHKTMNSKTLDIFKIKQGELGIINLNNMIPTPQKCLNLVLPTIKDKNYKALLEKQITYINVHKEKLYKKAIKFYNLYQNNKLNQNIMKRTCDFNLLEIKSVIYSEKELQKI